MNKRMELQPCQMFGNINKVIMSVQRSLKYFCYFMSWNFTNKVIIVKNLYAPYNFQKVLKAKKNVY